LRDSEDCPFCKIGPERIAFSWSHGHAIWDGFPVSPGHLLIVPKRHAGTWDDLTAEEKAAVTLATDQAMSLARERHTPDGFNVGFNLGAAAGQTVFHFHLHVIPRYSGDVADPRGGVRHVIPSKANYLSQSSTPELDQQRLIKGAEDPLLPHLILHMDRADTCDIAVSFLLDSGARRIVEHLKDFLARRGRARVLVGDYLDVTEPVALRRLSDLQGSLSLRVYRILTEPVFLPPNEWFEPPSNWPINTVGGKGYSSESAEGRSLWERLTDISKRLLSALRLFNLPLQHPADRRVRRQ